MKPHRPRRVKTSEGRYNADIVCVIIPLPIKIYLLVHPKAFLGLQSLKVSECHSCCAVPQLVLDGFRISGHAQSLNAAAMPQNMDCANVVGLYYTGSIHGSLDYLEGPGTGYGKEPILRR